MDIDHRPHNTTANNPTTSTSDLFVCFTSRFCSFSSMKLREPNKLSSSASLSRRLRASGSLKGGQSSPMLILTGSTSSNGNKKRGYAFENPEPSSPKVTCIGQVRVKSRKSGRSRGGKQNRERNQRWVHLPLSICEALKGFGADFNCLMPCLGGRSLCDSERDDGKMGVKRTTSGSCGAVFARWLMALQDEGDEVVDVGEMMKRERCGDGEAFGEGGFEIEKGKEEPEEVLKEENVEKGEEESVSICIPPRNALLLMRCRSDPLRISALANRFVWDPSPVPNEEDDSEEEEDNEEHGEEDEEDDGNVENSEDKEVEREVAVENSLEQRVEDDEEVVAKWVSSDEFENQENQETKSSENAEHSVQADEAPVKEEEAEQHQQQNEQESPEQEEDEIIINWPLFESFYQFVEIPEAEHTEEVEYQNRVPEQEQQEPTESQVSPSEESSSEIPSTPLPQEESEELKFSEDSTTENIEHDTDETTVSDLETNESSVPETEHQQQKSNVALPDCLLSMLCEPKLSMEISKETWVCSRDFIRHPHSQVNKINGSDDSNSQQVSTTDGSDSQKPNQPSSDQPPRSSFSNHPTAPNAAAAAAAAAAVPSMAAVVMQKLVSAAVAHEPFVLTRCKSEPLRSSGRLVPEACSWKNQNLQPHGRADLGLLAQPKC